MSVKSKLCGAVLGAVVSMYSLTSYAQETIHVGTEPTFAPFGFVDDKTSEIVGFDIDVINAIGKAEGINVVIDSMQFDGIIPSILSNSINYCFINFLKIDDIE